MPTVILVARISAESLDVDALARRFDGTSLAARAGGNTRLGERGDNAFAVNISLGDFARANQAIRAAQAFVRDAKDVIEMVNGRSGHVEIDFGMLVGAEESYAPSLTFTPETLVAFAAASVSIAVSAYPCSNA